MNLSSADTTVISLSVPTAKYVVFAEARLVVNDDNTIYFPSCLIKEDTFSGDPQGVRLDRLNNHSNELLSWHQAFTINVSSISVICNAGGNPPLAGTVTATVTLSAIQVGSVTSQQ